MPAWIFALLWLLVLGVLLGLLAWVAERLLAEHRQRREFRRWETGVLERFAAPASDEARLDDLRRLHAIVEDRMQRLGGAPPDLRETLDWALYLCATQPGAVRQRVSTEEVPSLDSVKAVLDRLDDEPERSAAFDAHSTPVDPADRPAQAEPSGGDDNEIPHELAAPRESVLRMGLRRVSRHPFFTAFLATLLGGLAVLLVAGWIGIGKGGGSTGGQATVENPKSKVGRQLTLHQNLANVDLEEADISGIHLNRKDMTEAHLAGAAMKKTDFTRAVLIKAEMTGADVTETVFVRAHLRGARLEEVVGNRPYFEHAKAAWAKLREARMPGASFVGAHLPHAYMVRAELPDAFFQEADLRSVEAAEAQLHDARLEAADLSDADLSSANLRDAQLYEANARSADFEYADLRGANLCATDLRGATFTAARLRGVRFNEKTRWPADFDPTHHRLVEGDC